MVTASCSGSTPPVEPLDNEADIVLFREDIEGLENLSYHVHEPAGPKRRGGTETFDAIGDVFDSVMDSLSAAPNHRQHVAADVLGRVGRGPGEGRHFHRVLNFRFQQTDARFYVQRQVVEFSVRIGSGPFARESANPVT